MSSQYKEISQGGMGTIYRAHQESLNRDVAIKTLRGLGNGFCLVIKLSTIGS